MDMLTADEAAGLLDEGEHPLNVFGQLDVASCWFNPTIDTKGMPPIARTNLGFGSPVSGRLAFPWVDIKCDFTGMPIILVLDINDMVIVPTNGNAIITCFTDGERTKEIDHHARALSSRFKSVVFPNLTQCDFSAVRNERYVSTAIKFSNGQILTMGDIVTLDPNTGSIYNGSLTIAPPVAATKTLSDALINLKQSNALPISITCHMQASEAAMRGMTLSDIYAQLNMPYLDGVGLCRTEQLLLIYLSDPQFRYSFKISHNATEETKDIFFANLQRNIQFNSSRSKQIGNDKGAYNSGNIPTKFRLADIFGDAMLPFFSAKTGGLVAAGEEHIIGSMSFRFREAVYAAQLGSLFETYSPSNELKNTVIIPSVATSDEVRHFKEIVKKEASRFKIKMPAFGVMIETMESLANIGKIAGLCDDLCFGTNDLTAAITKLQRNQLDHSDWMQNRGYRGKSPFDVLVPEVIGPMKNAIEKARRSNPRIRISVCGVQVGGHDIDSIEAVLNMGINEMVVSSRTDDAIRVLAIAARYFANIGPESTTNRQLSRPKSAYVP